MRLAADLGGTNARFALQSGTVRRVEVAARDFRSLDDVIAAALAAFSIRDARGIDALLAVAGPVHGTIASFTNLEWQADADALRERFGFKAVRLMNDVACAAREAAVALPDDRVTVQDGPRRAGARHMLVSVGTGLGVAYWRAPDDVEASEAGHSGFAPATTWDRMLLDHLLADHERVTWERVLSGPGLARIDALVDGGVLESRRRFSRLLGVFVGDLVLASPVTGGVLLAGGVIAGLGDAFDRDAFIEGFRDKGALQTLPAGLPVWRTADGALALRGGLR